MNPTLKRFYFDSEGLIFFEVNVYGETAIEKDIADFKALSERNRNTFDVLELPYGAHAQDFAESNGYRVNPDTKKLEFSYPVPGEPDAPQVFGPPLTERIEEIANENSELLFQNAMQDISISSLEDEVSDLLLIIANSGVMPNV